MKRIAVFLLVSFLLAAPGAEAQFLKKLGQELMSGATGQGGAGTAGQPAGTTNLPPGQYNMNNMQTGQSFYVMVDNNGQMYASVNNNGMIQPGGMVPGAVAPGMGQRGGLLQQGLQGLTGGQNMNQQMQPGMQQQQQGGMGGMMRGTLGNFLKNELTPQQQSVPQGY